MVLATLAKSLPDSFNAMFPSWQPWVDSLKELSLSKFIQDWFAQVEVIHVLGLFILSAAVLITCLRLIGVGLTEESPSTIQRNTRWLLHIGVVVAIASGLLIGMSNASKLYNSPIFTVKMIAMVAAVIFSYFVMVPVAKADGHANTTAKVGFVVAMALWLFALLIFSVKPGSNPGMFHVLWFGALILFAALPGKTRWVYTIGLLALIVPWQLLTHVFIRDGDGPHDFDNYMLTNRIFMYLTGAWILGLSLQNIFGKNPDRDTNAFAKITGYSTILVWVTVAACGRWIGLS